MQVNLIRLLCSEPGMLIIDFFRLSGSYRSHFVATGNNRQEQKKMSMNLPTGLKIKLPSCTDRSDIHDLELPQPFRTLGTYQQLSGHRRLRLHECFFCFPASITQSVFLTRLQRSFIDGTLIGHRAVLKDSLLMCFRAAAE